MKYDVEVRVTAIGTVRVEAEDAEDAGVMANDVFDPVKEADDYNLEVLRAEPVSEESRYEDQPPDFTDRGMSKDDYMESDIDFQDPQWDLSDDYQGA